MAMKVVGLVGGVASGKSAVARWLEQWGAAVIDADRLGHQVLEDPQVVGQLVDRWGLGICSQPGRIDRAAVAARVFGDAPGAAGEREFLEQTLHPRIRLLAERELEAVRAAGRRVAVLDAPLLLEAGWGSLCDLVVLVEASPEERRRRGDGRGWTREQFSAREAAQLPIEEKRARATHRLSNEGTLADLRDRVRDFWQQELGGGRARGDEMPGRRKE